MNEKVCGNCRYFEKTKAGLTYCCYRDMFDVAEADSCAFFAQNLTDEEYMEIGELVSAWDRGGGFRGGDGASGAWYVARVVAIDSDRGRVTVEFVDAQEDEDEPKIAEVNFAEVKNR